MGSEAGRGGYDRISVKVQIPDINRPPTNAMPQNAFIIIKVYCKLNIRSMEDPATTDFEISMNSSYINTPQELEIYRDQDLRPNRRRSITLTYAITGRFVGDPDPKLNFSVFNISWKDKTGVPADHAFITIAPDSIIFVLDQTIVMLPNFDTLTSNPNDCKLRETEDDEDRTCPSPFSLCSLDDSAWAADLA